MSDLAEAYDKNADALIRFAATLVGPANAEDVVSEAVLGALSAKQKNIDDLDRYLYRCVANSAKKHWRTTGRRARREALVLVNSPRLVTEYEPDPVPQQGSAIGQVLASLSPQQRAVTHLRYWEDLTPATIASKLDVSEGTVKRQLARANKKLSEVIGHG